MDARFQVTSTDEKNLEASVEGFFFDGRGQRILGRWVIKLGS